MRVLLTSICLLLAISCAVSADEGKAEISLSAKYEVNKAKYMRELWVAVPSENVNGSDMLKALRAAASETTTVAIIRAQYTNLAETAEEKAVLKQIQLRAGLKELQKSLNFHPHKKTRTVIVGFQDGAIDALRLASSSKARAEGVVMIDPPIAALEAAEFASKKRLGVDVLLHPASKMDFVEQSQRLRTALGSWGGTARILKSDNPFDSLEQRISEVWQTVRGYQLPMPSADLMKKLAEYDVIIVGELHGNPGAHALQYDTLKAMAASGGEWALAMEQFERDVQPHLDAYVKLKNPSSRQELIKARIEFLGKSRPWPNYADYAPMIEFSRESGMDVIAANIPRRLASRVSKEGAEVREKFTDDEKSWSARELVAEDGGYKDKFFGLMGRMGDHADNSAIAGMFRAQSYKDDTMAESIVDWIAQGSSRKVVLTVGRFHSAEGLGIPEKIAGLNPKLKVAMLTGVMANEKERDPAENEWIVTIPTLRPRVR